MAKIVAVTACPTGIAHTQMAAEALKRVAPMLSHSIRVETQSAEGAGSPLSRAEIDAADVVLIAADVHVDMQRFAHKPVVAVTTSEAIRKTRAVLEEAVAEATAAEPAEPASAAAQVVAPAPQPPSGTAATERRQFVAV